MIASLLVVLLLSPGSFSLKCCFASFFKIGMEITKTYAIQLVSLIAAKVESNIHIDSCPSLIRYATGIDSLFTVTKVTYTPNLDGSRTMA